MPDLELLRAALEGEITDLEILRTGGQAALFKGRRLRNSSGRPTNDIVAVKVYSDTDEDERVTREINAASSVQCETLVDFLSHGVAQLDGKQNRYLVCRFIDGESLAEFISKQPVDVKLATTIGRDVCSAIAALWQRGLVHRDINPKNIMLRLGLETAILIDLGIAKYVEQGSLTAVGETWGTRGYLSPEQATGLRLTCLSDIFSLGVTLQHALAGSHPTEFNQNRLNSGGRPTHEIAPQIPARLSHLIDRMVSVRPARRPAPNELIRAFGELTD